jgi:AbrB family looped-hinge helix DNA binding protein
MNIPKILGKRGRITIPLELRQRLDWKPGDTLNFRLENHRVTISREIAHEPDPTAKAEELFELLKALTPKEQFRFLALALALEGDRNAGV